jgi:hypothetical protein
MIDPKAEPLFNTPPRKPIDISGRKPRKAVITRQEIEDNIEPLPDPAYYEQEPWTGNWRLKQ